MNNKLQDTTTCTWQGRETALAELCPDELFGAIQEVQRQADFLCNPDLEAPRPQATRWLEVVNGFCRHGGELLPVLSWLGREAESLLSTAREALRDAEAVLSSHKDWESDTRQGLSGEGRLSHYTEEDAFVEEAEDKLRGELQEVVNFLIDDASSWAEAREVTQVERFLLYWILEA